MALIQGMENANKTGIHLDRLLMLNGGFLEGADEPVGTAHFSLYLIHFSAENSVFGHGHPANPA